MPSERLMYGTPELVSLLEVIRAGSINRASASLGYTPSAVSQQVRRLEKDLGVPLLARHSWGVAPTEAGQLVADFTVSLEANFSGLRKSVRSITDSSPASIAIGTFPVAGAALVGPALSRFMNSSNARDFHLVSDVLEILFDRIIDGEVDVAVLWESSFWPWEDFRSASGRLAPRLDTVDLCFEPGVLLLRSQDRPDFHLDSEFLEKFDWISRGPGHPATELLFRMCKKFGFSPRVAFEAKDYREAEAMVRAGVGATVGFQFAYLKPEGGLFAQVLPFEDLGRRVVAATRKGHKLSIAEKTFVDILKAEADVFR